MMKRKPCYRKLKILKVREVLIMTREEKIQFVAESIANFEDVDNTEKLQETVRNLSDEELEEKYEFADYLWDK
jgi:pyrimidine deaminase RibD-like protein